ncbi:MAG: IS66 family transposase [Gammaproteobacteria bacterium]|nr:IS66 family transposase [Gammaproteobacteria bacterium]
MAVRMAVPAIDISADGAFPAVAVAPIWSPPAAASLGDRLDWKSMHEQAHARAERERARADEAEARCKELLYAERDARSRAGSLKWHLDRNRGKLEAAAKEAKEARRAARHALPLQDEVARLTRLLSDAGIETGRCGTVASQPRAGQGPQAREARRSPYRESGRRGKVEAQKATIDTLRHEVRDLRKQVKEAETQESTIRGLSGMIECLRGRLRDFQDQRDRIRVLNWQVETLRLDLDSVRGSLKRSEDEKKALEAEIAELRGIGGVLSRRLFGGRSEQQKKSGTGRNRGQQRGASAHGRTPRPELEERHEEVSPPPEECVCGSCGMPYVPNGVEESALVEIEVKAHKRIIGRPRHRRTCACASSPMEVSAPPVPRLFHSTHYGISVWACYLYERYACFRTLNGVAAWMSGRGLAISPGTLGDSTPRMMPLFEPVHEAILAHQNAATLRYADETSWRVQELRGKGRSSRAWLWASVSMDAAYFTIDPSRSAEVALRLFAEARPGTIIVCDRYSAYKRLVRLLEDKAILAFCWAHQRRDCIDAAAGHPQLEQWCQGWIERIAAIFALNDARLQHHDPGRKRQKAAFRAATRELKKALDSLFADAEAELATLPDGAREGKALRSLLNHREGLCVFVDRPEVPMTNNTSERILRAPAIGRGLSFGSDTTGGADFTAIMYSVVRTLSMNGFDVLRWLEAWLQACAENGRKPPDDLAPWLPWSMGEERRRAFMAPG